MNTDLYKFSQSVNDVKLDPFELLSDAGEQLTNKIQKTKANDLYENGFLKILIKRLITKKNPYLIIKLRFISYPIMRIGAFTYII